MAGEKTDQDYIQEIVAEGRREAETARQRGERFNRIKLSRTVANAQNPSKKNEYGSIHTRSMSAKELYEEARRIDPNATTYNHAATAGRVVECFPTEASQRGLSFTACEQLIVAWNHLKKDSALTDSQRKDKFARLVSDCSAAIPFMADPNPDYVYTEPFTVADVRRQVDIVTGKQVSVESKQIGNTKTVVVGAVEKAVEGLPKKKAAIIVKAVSVEIEREVKKLQAAFSDEVNKKAEEIAKNKTASLWEAGTKFKEKAELMSKLAENRLKGASALMTKAEFRLILNCLHPDRAPADRREKFSEAFGVVKRLEHGTAWDEA
jgi:hypothetical protein